eukprot:TRINITY_DN18274_c0_g1_i1.p1 TRINITY_DN18274_c0_g1~~TRINITY_DN18274_c0_g1_i1.p1  ORF type:complete len:183 (-),score=30.85 TRINITY_DN18274_c0_g1_i1:87-569(-)
MGDGEKKGLLPRAGSKSALVESYISRAMARAREAEVKLPELTGPEMRAKEAKEGLNSLGLSKCPKAEKKGWGWCVDAPNRAHQMSSSVAFDLNEQAVSVASRPGQSLGFSRADSYDPIPHGERPFFGEPRPLGFGAWDGRMKGGKMARNGWHGTGFAAAR